MTTEAQGIHLINAWDQLLTAMKDAGEEDLEALLDFHVIHMVGGFQAWPELARQLHHAAELIREAVRVSGKDKVAEVKA